MSESLTYALVIVEDALREIDEQAQYYEERSETGLAQRWSEAAQRTIKSLLSMPHRCALCRFTSPSLRNIRRLPVQGFDELWVFFHADDSLAQVTVVAVLHLARNVEAILSERRM